VVLLSFSLFSTTYHYCLYYCQLPPARRLLDPPGNLARDSELFSLQRFSSFSLFYSFFKERSRQQRASSAAPNLCIRLRQMFLLGHIKETASATDTVTWRRDLQHELCANSGLSTCAFCLSCSSQTTRRSPTGTSFSVTLIIVQPTHDITQNNYMIKSLKMKS
jgi:hypothetical protein